MPRYFYRSLGYRFYPHFHPYVHELVKRLNDGSVAGLEAADTEYVHNPDGSIAAIANSTRAAVVAKTEVSLVEGGNMTLPEGAPIALLDNSQLTFAAGTMVNHLDGTPFPLAADTTVTLPGSIPVSSPGGIQFAPANAPAFIVPDRTLLRLPGTTLCLLTDATVALLPPGTEVTVRSPLPLPLLYATIFSPTRFAPSAAVQPPNPVKDVDFSVHGAYSCYNWELFFHIPLLVAVHLSQNQKFQDAQKWFHYIFDPTDSSNGPTPQRFWKVRPFQSTDVELIADILVNLSSGADPQLRQDTIDSINAWKATPFQPFLIGKYRPTSFMLKTLMAYLDNLIAWGDTLFKQDSGETVNEALQLYVLAANILGPRPQPVPAKGSAGPRSYADIRGSLDKLSNALVDFEVDAPFEVTGSPASSDQSLSNIKSIGQSLFFCVPFNDKLLSYWDTVADRLFKIHNSLNLQGVFRQLPLFEPPIDPALLVRATAAGVNVSAVVSGLNQPLPLVRFRLMLSKAVELCQEVKALGAGILSAIEKQDGESLALLRAKHETNVLGLAETVKYSQWQEAIKSRQALEQSLTNAAQRYSYFQKQLGRSDSEIQNLLGPTATDRSITVPAMNGLDSAGLQQLNFSQAGPNSEQMLSFDEVDIDIASNAAEVSDGNIKTLSRHEVGELKGLAEAKDLQTAAGLLDLLGKDLSLLPQFGGKVQPIGAGVDVTFGGVQLSTMISMMGSSVRMAAEDATYGANKSAKLGTYARRQQEWAHQGNLAKGEMTQILKQLRAAQIREALAQKEFENHKVQMQQAQEIEDFLQGNSVKDAVKETTAGFYALMKREVKGLYAKSFDLAYEAAKKAERALQHELGDTSLNFIQFNYLDGVEGLYAGEKLHADIKRMELSYYDLNRREYELTKHVSLLQVAPLALVQLRATGSCTFTLSEEIFDIDKPAFFRRIKSVALTIPCVTGPYTGVNCTLTLLNSSIRTTPRIGNGYTRTGTEDTRFSDYSGSIESVVTSSSQSDSGLFEANLNDERYLPFELSGAIGQWKLDLPSRVRQFDYDTISDVILHIRYTAREGGDEFTAGAAQHLSDQIEKAQTVGSVRLLSARHDFPTEWARFKSVRIAGDVVTAGMIFTLLPQHYPFWAQGLIGQKSVIRVDLLAEMLPGATANVNVFDNAEKRGKGDVLARDPSLGSVWSGTLVNIAKPPAVADATQPPFTLYLDDNSMKDLWVAITWGKG